jgi:hypothetical protein
MSILDGIREGIRDILAADMLTDSWEYAQRTSASGADPATYGAWTAINALFTGENIVDQIDDARDEVIKVTTASLRTSDSATRLKMGDLVRKDNATWVVASVLSSGPGTIRYQIERRRALRGDPGRGGAP